MVVGQDGEVSVLDEDGFEEHRALYDYPDELVVDAEAVTQHVLKAIEFGHGPFDGGTDEWFRLL